MNTKIIYTIANNGFGFSEGMTLRVMALLGEYALVKLLDGEDEDYMIIEAGYWSDTIQRVIIRQAKKPFSGRDKDPLKEWVDYLTKNFID